MCVEKGDTHMIDLPSHDDIVGRIQEDVVAAVDKIGWANVLKSCWGHGVSVTMIRKIYYWTPHSPRSGDQFSSFNLGKLFDAHSWAEDVRAGRTIQGAEWQG
jgi:hypothetical protein